MSDLKAGMIVTRDESGRTVPASATDRAIGVVTNVDGGIATVHIGSAPSTITHEIVERERTARKLRRSRQPRKPHGRGGWFNDGRGSS